MRFCLHYSSALCYDPNTWLWSVAHRTQGVHSRAIHQSHRFAICCCRAHGLHAVCLSSFDRNCHDRADRKFATASDDQTVGVFDFERAAADHIFRGKGIPYLSICRCFSGLIVLACMLAAYRPRLRRSNRAVAPAPSAAGVGIQRQSNQAVGCAHGQVNTHDIDTALVHELTPLILRCCFHREITTVHSHKSPVTKLRWNMNGNWFLS